MYAGESSWPPNCDNAQIRPRRSANRRSCARRAWQGKRECQYLSGPQLGRFQSFRRPRSRCLLPRGFAKGTTLKFSTAALDAGLDQPANLVAHQARSAARRPMPQPLRNTNGTQLISTANLPPPVGHQQPGIGRPSVDKCCDLFCAPPKAGQAEHWNSGRRSALERRMSDSR